MLNVDIPSKFAIILALFLSLAISFSTLSLISTNRLYSRVHKLFFCT